MVDALNAAGAQPGAPAKPNALATLSNNYETFLKLLTEQLKNQDPLQPQDASEFTNQLVQFSQVEQQIASNDKLESLIDTMNMSRPAQALNYIGKVVEMQGNGLALQEGVADMAITLPAKATEAFVEIRDSTGALVQVLSMPKTAGFHEVRWDGKSGAGVQMKDGFYQAVVKATGEDGKPMETLMHTSGRVTGVDSTDGETFLVVGGMAVRPEDVLSVRTHRMGG